MIFDWNLFDWDIEYVAIEFFIFFFIYLLFADLESKDKLKKEQLKKEQQNPENIYNFSIVKTTLIIIFPGILHISLLIINTLFLVEGTFARVLYFFYWVVYFLSTIILFCFINRKVRKMINKFDEMKQETGNVPIIQLNRLNKSIIISNLILLSILTVLLVDLIIQFNDFFLIGSPLLRISIFFPHISYIIFLNGTVLSAYKQNPTIDSSEENKINKIRLVNLFFINLTYYLVFLSIFLFLISPSLLFFERLTDYFVLFGVVHMMLFIWYFKRELKWSI